ncbi:glycosyl hydrolase family 47 [Onchocerca flexuosa]|uniref:alpha-1,2-Mannosidase n=1 Tax=Onchocerca flexuosa TaxID=387005 RepID=A0A238BU78_9BILA|nr:glycosyl hydrolase family 47 [Onchocerca flexuosa]
MEKMRKLYRSGSEGHLPFLVNPIAEKRTSLRMCRHFFQYWRSLARLQRSVILTLFFFLFVLCFIAAKDSIDIDSLYQLPRNIANNAEPIDVPPDNHKLPEAPPDKEPALVNESNGESESNEKKNDKNKKKQKIQKLTYPKFKGPQNDKQKAVVNAFKHAWEGYKKHAWGHDHLKPVSKSHNDWFGLGLTIIDSLSTAIIMGLDEGNLFETTIRVLGGLLSAYHLSGDEMFVHRAHDLGSRLATAYATPSAIPYGDVSLMNREGKQPLWTTYCSLAEIGTLQLEFRDLSRVTNNNTYEMLAFRTSEQVHNEGCVEHDGLCSMFINPVTGRFNEHTTITMGARADSFYEYLLKQWLQTGKTIDWLKNDYNQSMAAMEKHLLRYSKPNNFAFVGEILDENVYSPKMDHLACFIAGTLALGSLNGLPAKHLELAKDIAKGCHKMYETKTGLAPEIIYFNVDPASTQDISIEYMDAHNLLRPEAFEAWFYLYRATGDKIYQQWGWEAFRAIESHAKLEYGYSSINNVKRIPVTYRDKMESFFLAETLKYLYLLFDDDKTDIPLDKYVFNTEGHPLPIYDH